MGLRYVLLNAGDFHEKGFEVKLIIEGAATGLIPEMAKGKSLHTWLNNIP